MDENMLGIDLGLLIGAKLDVFVVDLLEFD